MENFIKYILLFFAIVLILFFLLLYAGQPKRPEKMVWGVNFSIKQVLFLELDPQETYLAILDDLKAKNIKISVHWDLVEPQANQYDFEYLDWQVAEAEKRNAQLILAIGMKTPRWPECHLPQWAMNLSKEQQQEVILDYLQTTVLRYKDSPVLSAWQVENEPFLKFGSCPWADENFVKKEVALVKQLDPKHPILITESGELSFWTKAAQIGDIVGFTTYRTVWQEQLQFYFSYNPWISPVYYYHRAELIKKFYHKNTIGVELQAEPWCPHSIMNATIEEQQKSMSLEQFKEAISFAQSTGIDTYYFWGTEWWYWMKVKQNHPEYWQEAQKLFNE
ncbi:MAG TPA: beta-galactosidase [Candidatus Pacearchaeota archaeon]|jgi:hypothetical protein|nr:beta-galactosidase [Candidatus Pacearchaeota archaeon]HRR94696.1 beta-galactosidase [Candidatus Paceibacterota bacterium]HQG09189.1 beta-galactosidase [Candidatus Pacearchaeota archaeon]HQH20245.1 beta-galactosidase [Candidatus Pacearchaeota archaeon]HQK58405.1 beta-galactosidase [Candidatus Pacearchaeota archaeon]